MLRNEEASNKNSKTSESEDQNELDLWNERGGCSIDFIRIFIQNKTLHVNIVTIVKRERERC
jgi:hypothetical protein